MPGKSKPEEFIIFCSHYDHVGTTNTNLYGRFCRVKQDDKKDGIYNGANDNASGTSAVILLAKYFAAKNQNERTILFFPFSGEEICLKGSYNFSSKINPEKIKAVVNIEMTVNGLSTITTIHILLVTVAQIFGIP